MLWSRTEPHKLPSPPASVPDTQALLHTALQASWKRDRRVGKSRLALRWLLWAFLRYGLPMVLMLAAAVALWVWLLPGLHQTLAMTRQSRLPTVVAPEQAPLVPATAAVITTDDIPADNTDTLQLSPEKTLMPSRTPPGGTNPLPTTIDPVNNPSLKPENWLHSKEP